MYKAIAVINLTQSEGGQSEHTVGSPAIEAKNSSSSSINILWGLSLVGYITDALIK